MRWGRLVLGIVGAEAIPILLLVALVAVFGPSDAAAASAYAEREGRWFGPLAGFLATLGAAFLVSRGVAGAERRHGVCVGIGAALLDVSLLLASRPAFDWVFVLSNVGRVLAGAIGGVLAQRAAAARGL